MVSTFLSLTMLRKHTCTVSYPRSLHCSLDMLVLGSAA